MTIPPCYSEYLFHLILLTWGVTLCEKPFEKTELLFLDLHIYHTQDFQRLSSVILFALGK